MVLKIRKKSKTGEYIGYKSSKILLTSKDKRRADEFDLNLTRAIKKIESILINRKILSAGNKKRDPLRVWYVVGKQINKFLIRHEIAQEDEASFWNYMYGRSLLIHKGVPSTKISQSRNDFRTASLLARYPLKTVKKVGPWALWREILSYKAILNDDRVLRWVTKKLIKSPRTRDAARPFLRAVNDRFKRVDTTILEENELLKKLSELKK